MIQETFSAAQDAALWGVYQNIRRLQMDISTGMIGNIHQNTALIVA